MRTVEVTDAVQAYLDGLVPERDPVLARMEEEAHRGREANPGAGHGDRLQRDLDAARHRRWDADQLRGRRQARSAGARQLRRGRLRQAGARPGAGRRAGVGEAAGAFRRLLHRPVELIPIRGRDSTRAGAMHRAPRWGGAAAGGQRVAPGRGGEAEDAAGEKRGVLQPTGGQAPAPGQRGGPNPGRPVNRPPQGLTRSAESPSIQYVPSLACSFFQIGTVSLSLSIPHLQAAMASARCGLDTETTTEGSPISRRPVRCAIATRAEGHFSATSSAIFLIWAVAISA